MKDGRKDESSDGEDGDFDSDGQPVSPYGGGGTNDQEN